MTQDVWLGIVSAVATVLVAVITTFGAAALRALAKRMGVQIDAAQRDLILAHAIDAVRWAEEQARKGVVAGGDAKAEAARTKLRKACDAGKLSCGSDEDLDALIGVALQTVDRSRALSSPPPAEHDATPTPALGTRVHR